MALAIALLSWPPLPFLRTSAARDPFLCLQSPELPAAPLCFRLSVENEMQSWDERCVLSYFILSFPCSCCWSTTWRLSAPACPCAGLALGHLCHRQQRHMAREGSPGQWAPMVKGPACNSFLVSSFIQPALEMVPSPRLAPHWRQWSPAGL